jgi:hypothetical protein
LVIGNIVHTKTKVRNPQTNSICERLHRIIQEEFRQVACRKKVYTYEELQVDPCERSEWYRRALSGRRGDGRNPLQTFRETKHLVYWKMVGRRFEPKENAIDENKTTTVSAVG